MPCFVPFNNKSLDLSFSVLRPTGVFAEELIGALKCFSFHAEGLGCAYSSLFKSIHGNLIIWYGAWIKRSHENREILKETLLSALAEVSHLAIILHHGFFDAYAGESKADGGGHPVNAAKFSTGDTIFLSGIVPKSGDHSDLSYACLALLRSCFLKTEGISAAVCLQSHKGDKPMVGTLLVWKSLGDCYSWLFKSDYRNTILPYVSHLSDDAQFDIFKVVYVNNDDAVNVRFFPFRMIGRANLIDG